MATACFAGPKLPGVTIAVEAVFMHACIKTCSELEVAFSEGGYGPKG